MNIAVFSRVVVTGLLCALVVMTSACSPGGDTDEVDTHAVPSVADDEPLNHVDTSGADLGKAQFYGQTRSGEATYYRATGKGNCSFEASDDLMVAAINTKDYDTAAMCGAYLTVTGPEGEVIVRIVDRCPACKPGDLDLSKQAFERVAKTSDGRVPVTWQIVSGSVSGPVEYFYMDGTTRYWTAIQLRNHRWPISRLEILPAKAKEWLKVERRVYNYFVYPKPIAAGSLKVRVTSVTGEILEDELPEPTGGLLIQGKAQFQ